MVTFKVSSTNNGYIVNVINAIKHAGEYVFKTTEEVKLLEFLGQILLEKKIKVEEN